MKDSLCTDCRFLKTGPVDHIGVLQTPIIKTFGKIRINFDSAEIVTNYSYQWYRIIWKDSHKSPWSQCLELNLQERLSMCCLRLPICTLYQYIEYNHLSSLLQNQQNKLKIMEYNTLQQTSCEKIHNKLVFFVQFKKIVSCFFFLTTQHVFPMI